MAKVPFKPTYKPEAALAEVVKMKTEMMQKSTEYDFRIPDPLLILY
jgi:hypothetical protein